MCLNSSATAHEVDQHLFSVDVVDCFRQGLVVSTAVIFSSVEVLPWQDYLIVISKPIRLEICVPVIHGKLCVGFAHDGQVFDYSRGTRSLVGENCDVYILGESCVEESGVAGRGSVI